MRTPLLIVVAGLATSVMLGFSEPGVEPQPVAPEAAPGVVEAFDADAIASAHASGLIEHLTLLNPTILSGGEPKSEEAFDQLAALGVRTIVSVDGATPNLEAAKARGIRYIHIPFGYAGVTKEAKLALAKVAAEVEGPIFVHCHHGQHRGPVGAGMLLACKEGLSGEQAAERLGMHGFPRKYAGLYRSLSIFDPMAMDVSEAPALVERAQVDSMPAAMAALDRHWYNFDYVKAADWKAPPDHPDIVPEHEALILAEAFREINRHLMADEPEDAKAWMLESETLAWALRDALLEGDAARAAELHKQLAASCKQCHDAYRD